MRHLTVILTLLYLTSIAPSAAQDEADRQQACAVAHHQAFVTGCPAEED